MYFKLFLYIFATKIESMKFKKLKQSDIDYAKSVYSDKSFNFYSLVITIIFSNNIFVPSQNGLDKLNKVSEDFSSLDNSIQSLQNLFDKYQLVIDELGSINYNNDLDEEDDKLLFAKYKYIDVPFLPYQYFKPVFKTQIDNLKMCPKVKEELKKCNEILKENIKKTELFYKNLSSFASNSNESFGYNTANFSQSLVLSDAGIEEKYGILFFYLSNLVKSKKITSKSWQETKKSSLNPLNILPTDIQKIYNNYSFNNLVSFSNKYCNFLTNEYLYHKSTILISFLKNVDKIIYFLETGSLDNFDKSFDFENELLRSIGGPEIFDYFLQFSIDLGKAGNTPLAVARAFKARAGKRKYQNEMNTSFTGFKKSI